MTRRDRCYDLGTSMAAISGRKVGEAWFNLGLALMELGGKDVPKFDDLLAAIEIAVKEAIGQPLDYQI